MRFELLLDVMDLFLNLRESARTPARITPYPHGTALLGWRCPRHFVPGYDRTVPPGHFATGFSHIQNRVEHHRLRSFQEEYIRFLNKHGIGFQERYLWD
jgi:hypothetical protein